MTIEGLVLEEAVRHIADFSHVKGMDPMALHILKTSEKPILVEMRKWMRRAALNQCMEAHREQRIMNEEFRQTTYAKGNNFRRAAVLHPYFATSMIKRDKTSWNDPDYVGYVKREEPRLFPKRDCH